MTISFNKLKAKMGVEMTKNSQLGKKYGISANTIGKIRNGEIDQLPIKVLDALCEEYDCQPGDLMEYIPDNNS